MSEQRQEAREAVDAIHMVIDGKEFTARLYEKVGPQGKRGYVSGFGAGYRVGKQEQAEQDAVTIDGLKQDREFAYRSRMQFWEENQRLRAALEACMAALEPGVWDETMEDDDECAPAIAQARAALGQEAAA